MSNQEPNKDIERIIHERLRALPDRPAPRDLVPGVMARIAARKARVWWQCPWTEWPREIRLFSVMLALGMIGVAVGFRMEIMTSLTHLGGRAAAGLSFLHPLWTVPAALLEVFRILLGSIQSHLLLVGALVIAGLYFSAVGVGALFYRVAAGKN